MCFISWFGPVRIWIPLQGAPCFPFYKRRESVGYSGGKGEERDREEGFQDRRVLLLLHAGLADPVDVNRGSSMSWPYSSLAQVSSAGHGVPFHPNGRLGELTRLSAFERGLGRTAPARPTLFLM